MNLDPAQTTLWSAPKSAPQPPEKPVAFAIKPVAPTPKKPIARTATRPAAEPAFKIELKKARPLWRDAVAFCLCVGGMWSLAHVAMNWGAYAQIANFRLSEARQIISASREAGDQNAPQEEKLTLLAQTIKVESDTPVGYFVPVPDARAEAFQSLSIAPSDDRIVIPRIKKNVPLVNVPDHSNWEALEADIQNALEEGVAIHPVSREPNQNGNFFITGHSSYYPWKDNQFTDVFALLHEVNVGDEVEVYRRGKKYTYKIKESMVVTPDQVDVLSQPNDRQQLTLMTCTPVGTAAKRLILIGEPVVAPRGRLRPS